MSVKLAALAPASIMRLLLPRSGNLWGVMAMARSWDVTNLLGPTLLPIPSRSSPSPWTHPWHGAGTGIHSRVRSVTMPTILGPVGLLQNPSSPLPWSHTHQPRRLPLRTPKPHPPSSAQCQQGENASSFLLVIVEKHVCTMAVAYSNNVHIYCLLDFHLKLVAP